MTVSDPSALTLSKQALGYDDLDADGNLSPGDRVHYRVDYGNPGPEAATGVVLRDEPDVAHVASVEALSAGGVFDGATIAWSIGTLEAGADGYVTYDVVLRDASAFGGTPTTTTTATASATTSTTETPATTVTDTPAGEPQTTVTDPPATESPSATLSVTTDTSTTSTTADTTTTDTTPMPVVAAAALFALAGPAGRRLFARGASRRHRPN
jgi:hypothetical protein